MDGKIMVTYKILCKNDFNLELTIEKLLTNEKISKAIKMERLHKVKELIKSQKRLFNSNMVGRTMEILADRLGKDKKQIIGRIFDFQFLFFYSFYV